MSESETSRGTERLVIGGGTLAAFLLIWEFAADSGLVNPLFIASPSRIVIAAERLFAEGAIWHDLAVSGSEFAAGYVLAALIGIPIGLATGWSKRFHYLIAPFIDSMNAVPRVTLLPIIVIWFGIGLWSKIAVVFLGAVIPIVINTYAGVRTSEARFVRVARSFGASSLRVFATIALPGSLPFIFTGLKYAAGRALLGVVVGELYAATAGIGHLIVVAGNALRTDEVFVGVLIVTATGLVVVQLLDRLERRFDAWRPKVGSAV
jgi:NitT/TauT family transport system permease protein